MFDVNAELKQFKPIDLSSIRQKLGQIPEDMQNAIELYNKALEDVAGKMMTWPLSHSRKPFPYILLSMRQ